MPEGAAMRRLLGSLAGKSIGQQGFSLVELLVVMGIFAVVVGMTTVGIVRPHPSVSVTASVDEIVADIRGQQLKAMMGDGGSATSAQPHGVYIETNQYTLFKGTSYSGSDPDNVVTQVQDGVSLSTSLPSSQVVFEKGSGEVANYTNGASDITIQDSASGVATLLALNRFGSIMAFTGGGSCITGGTVATTTLNGTVYRVHTFTAPGTMEVDTNGNLDEVEYLVVAGGGGGGGIGSGNTGGGGGGGAGGLRTNIGGAGETLTAGLYPVAVGDGGTAGVANSGPGGSGGSSSFNGIVASGGGGGASVGNNNGAAGGSGGGGRANSSGLGGNGTAGQGNRGGNGASSGNSAGGGGGASVAGSNGSTGGIGGGGGAGTLNDITGSSITYAGGGGGGAYNNVAGGAGGVGGGGTAPTGRGVGTPGADGLGGGGSGASGSSSGTARIGGTGGSGIVIVRYPLGNVDCSGTQAFMDDTNDDVIAWRQRLFSVLWRQWHV